ncbi:MAG: thiolase family protein [Pseudomonadota bacterium]
MTRRVGICAVAQTPYKGNFWEERFQGMGLMVLESLLEQTGVDFSENGGIDMSISVSNDVFDARTISDNAMTDVLGAHYRCEEKVDQDGSQAVYYALAAIQSGHCDKVLILGHCKESQCKSRNMVSHLTFDPFYTRPVGLDYLSAAGMQARAYGARAGITDVQLARIVARCRAAAAKNPLLPDAVAVTEAEVLASPMLADPIRELHAYPVSDGAIGMILAAEDVARRISKRPVWITGVGNAMDHFFLGDRDPGAAEALKAAAKRAYRRAGITDPGAAFDVVEVCDQYAYQQPMWMEGLGLVPAGGGGRWLDAGGPDAARVNLSGGMLAGNPMILGGLTRVADVVRQLSGIAGDGQVPDARTGLAHGVTGPAGQFHTVITLSRD